ncbi:MAG: bifunctional methylenetetrahydrofolate dehydrogenase/methenyltetrahydrofolate cyclohydrolase FolD [Gemmatimonadota bacterium]|nr:MAG: bifunctional methylenetetrahydrofolate dehydrogenase/methenyltetrahydrofolate cyclohydrolase FolD [Gemmatimonadota bacterium]
MAANLIDGRRIGSEIREELRKQVADLKKQGIVPGLAVILVGDDPASRIYVRMKEKACVEMGFYSVTERLGRETSQSELLQRIEQFNNDPNIHGILVQLPLPDHLDEEQVLMALSPEKDVDGFHPVNIGRLVAGNPFLLPATPAGIQQLLIRSGYTPEGKHIVIVGRSNIVGKPMANILIQKKEGANATVTICHTGTSDIRAFTRQADILIVAAGRPEFVTGDMIRPGAVVIDVGVNRVEDASSDKGYRLAGDVHFASAREVAAAITPVPGGVGPMTITMLLSNTVQAARFFRKEEEQGWIGTDEAGKGDYFGPLVVAGVYVNRETEAKLRLLNIRDSKRVSDTRVKSLATEIKKICPWNVVAIGPEKYNTLYEKMKNLNRILAWGHARAIENLLGKVSCARALSDQFGDERFILDALLKRGKEIKLEQKTKAEDDIAVAAASLLARAEFLSRLEKLSSKWGIAFPKGATKVVEDGKKCVKKHGPNVLSKVAKVHFKTTRNIRS